jgi:predicted RNase H-like HicB family nuclease
MTDQPDEATYDAYLLRYPDGSWLAQLTDLPGAYAVGASQEDATERLARAVPGYFTWLSQHDEYTPITKGVARVTAREVAQAGQGSVYGAFFSGDAQPVTEEDLDWWLAALDWAYGDLAALTRRLPASQSRDASLGATCETQARIVSSVTGLAFRVPPGADALAMLEATRDAAIAIFRTATAEQRGAVREEAGERWSLRRGLRESALLARRADDMLAAQA